MITDPDIYFSDGCGRCANFCTDSCSARKWRQGLLKLRQILNDIGFEEVAKWGHPCYMHNQQNVVILGAFKGDFRLTFFNAGLMKDPEQIMKKQGPNTQNPNMISFADEHEVDVKEPIIRRYLEEAKKYAAEGLKAESPKRELEMPAELIEALDSDPELAEAFFDLTPGRQRSYIFNLMSAKQSTTRINRIEKFRPKIIAGKGALE